MKYIESRQNKIIKKTISLKEKKYREKNKLFIAEGLRLFKEIPKEIIEYTICDEEYTGVYECDYCVSHSLFSEISDTVTSQGIIGVCKIKPCSEPSFKEKPFFVILENVTDPGNLGTVIRTCDAAGVDGIFLSKGCVDIYNPKTIRATMGSLFHLPIYPGVDITSLLEELKSNNITTYSAHLKGIKTPYEQNLKKGCAIIIGNEANGISRETVEKTDELVKIPILGKAESLNAAVAASILIYEAVRQRME